MDLLAGTNGIETITRTYRAMKMMLSDLFLLASILMWSSAQILDLNPGQVRGFEYSTKDGEIAEVFLAIPYAAPPVGDLRFEKPAAVSPWKGVHNGTAFGPTCHPHTRQAILPPNPSEDCLTLNVIRPKKEAPPGGYPILLWVHGGGYEVGSASLYGYKGFADIYIPHDIIVITIQYRLGVYGFFSSGDSRIPGNLGLFDMAAAVKFVHENAENIGANAARITAWGLSAGGAAVGQLALSPVSRDYIARSIEMSGSPWAAWALGPNVPSNSLELAEAMIRPKFLTNNWDKMINDVVAYYVDRDEEDAYDFYLERYTEFISDVMFNVPAVDGILARRGQGWNLFAYSFNHYNKAIWHDDITERLRGLFSKKYLPMPYKIKKAHHHESAEITPAHPGWTSFRHRYMTCRAHWGLSVD
ncbi:Carboxylesterase [Teladorsagia circumcincta]|uniref:Carboxylesterase n=1 Tax=Teladorsagia circumcincta TaxID=45464 RepID=A0A2G9TR94_TELCI|nr:Carboxylesterase [Teladorsagia circumcincta]